MHNGSACPSEKGVAYGEYDELHMALSVSSTVINASRVASGPEELKVPRQERQLHRQAS